MNMGRLSLCLSILTSVKAEGALVADHLLKAVEAALVHEFSHQRAAAPLVLHACLHQVDGIHGCGTHSYQKKTTPKNKHLDIDCML